MDESHRKSLRLNKRTSLEKFMTQISEYKMLLNSTNKMKNIFPVLFYSLSLCAFETRSCSIAKAGPASASQELLQG